MLHRVNENLMAILWCLREYGSGTHRSPSPPTNLATAELMAFASRLGLNDHPSCDHIC